jgi:AcrR family transcriptional regulator
VRRSAEEATAQILEAAEAEFTQYGVTGARIDRIAKEAGASKERLYAYFGDKEGLFDQVIRNASQRLASAVPIEQDDLVAYAGRLVEHLFTHPGDLRLMGWTRLDERCERALQLDTVVAYQAERVAAVRRAQAAGLVDPSWDPDELLKLVQAIASYWASATGSGGSPSRCRWVAEEAVRRLIEPRQ